MQALRASIHRHRLLAAMLVALALAMKIAVPAGFMLGQQGKVLTVAICADASGTTVTKQIVVPASGTHEDGKAAHAKASATCPYAALGFPALGGADVALLALALAFIVALSLAPAPLAPRAGFPHARPPLRGPPARA